jgi:hypothetical protein
MTNMPNASGTSRRTLRCPMKRCAGMRMSMNPDATPETRNSKPSRHGEDSSMNGSSALLVLALFTCQSQLT